MDWSLGEYEQTAAQLLPAAKFLVDAANIVGGERVIDLGCGTADLLLSVFGVIFAPDPKAAAAEMARVTAPGGRIVLSAWIPEGAIPQAARVGREAVAAALQLPSQPPSFAWHEVDALSELLGPHDFTVTAEERSHAFTADSARAWVEAEARNHPLQVAGTAALGPSQAEAVLDRTMEIFEDANEDSNAFKVTSRYVIATAQGNS